ncbi:MAG: hypothetical protein LQ352_001894 [Teloschistes flavicans]|nr:MAG: hypothetical protein LQ352_001894 [Teloschistes flavicans]
MSTLPPSATVPAVDPLTATAHDASTDPVRTNATQDLTPESRPEVTESTSAPAADTTGTDAAVENLPKDAAVVVSQPINEGVLSYKQPGLVKSLIYSKKFFWFGDEPVETKYLSDYLRGEKATDVARPNAAHATQTGKGLLFFAKRAEDKPQPQGIINLADIQDVTKAGLTDFTFKYHSHKHAFQAMNATERDGWLVALETRQADAKTNREGIVGSEGYKSSLDKFAKPAAVGAVSKTSRSLSRHKKTSDTKAADSAAPVTAGFGGDATSDSDEVKARDATSRSQSRKRASVFGSLLSNIQKDHDERKEERKAGIETRAEERDIKHENRKAAKAREHTLSSVEKSVVKREEREEAQEEKRALKSDGVVDPLPLDAAAVANRVLDAPVVNADSTNTQIPTTASAESAALPSNVATETPLSETPRETAPKANKRNSIFGNLFAKKENAPPNASLTGPPASTTTDETAAAVPAEDTEPAATSPVAPQAETVASGTAPVTDTAAPTETPATAPTTSTTTSPVSPETTKANRRTSFFSNLGTKKEKKASAVSDTEGTDGEGKKSGGFGGLLRKASRAQGPKSTPKTASATNGTSDTETPAPTTKETPATETMTNGENTTADVIPNSTTTTSQQTPVQATA